MWFRCPKTAPTLNSMIEDDYVPCVNCGRTDEHLVFIAGMEEFDKTGDWCVPCVEAVKPEMGAAARAIGLRNPYGYVGTSTGCAVVLREMEAGQTN